MRPAITPQMGPDDASRHNKRRDSACPELNRAICRLSGAHARHNSMACSDYSVSVPELLVVWEFTNNERIPLAIRRRSFARGAGC